MKSESEKTQKQRLSRLLQTYQPHPGDRFYQRMANAPWKPKEIMSTSRAFKPARFLWQFAAALVFVLIVLSLAIPSVRASVSAWLGISIAPSNQMPATTVDLVETTPTTSAGIEQPTGTISPQPTVDPLSAQAGWTVLNASSMPDGYQFDHAMFDRGNQMVITSYFANRSLPGAADTTLTETKTITLVQALHNDFNPLQVAPSTNLEDVQINGKPAVYAIGAWDAEFVPDSSDPNGGKMVSTWRNDLQIQNVFWQVGKVYLVLISDDPQVSRQDLIDMAASIGK